MDVAEMEEDIVDMVQFKHKFVAMETIVKKFRVIQLKGKIVVMTLKNTAARWHLSICS